MNLVEKHPPSIQPSRFVIGPGALGLFLTDDFIFQPYVIYKNAKPEVFQIVKNGVPEHAKEIQLFRVEDLSHLLAWSAQVHLEMYVCVPPAECWGVIQQLISLLPTLKVKIFIINCSNGLFLHQMISLQNQLLGAAKSGADVTLVRALVNIGVRKKKAVNGDVQQIIVGGQGRQILYQSLSPTQTWTPPDSKEIQWKKDENLSSGEAKKFFGNLMLTHFIGREEKPNKDILTKTNPQKIQVLCKEYAQLMKPVAPINEKEIYQFFLNLIHDTGDNINSVSSSWAQGNLSPAKYFLQECKDKLKSSGQNIYPQLHEIVSSLEQRIPS